MLVYTRDVRLLALVVCCVGADQLEVVSVRCARARGRQRRTEPERRLRWALDVREAPTVVDAGERRVPGAVASRQRQAFGLEDVYAVEHVESGRGVPYVHASL